MKMQDYFESTAGRGVLATAGNDGRVDAAIYSTPHVLEDNTVAFIMRERLSHQNVQENPHATFLFVEEGAGSRGVRLFLKKIKEETDTEKIKSMMRRHLSPAEDKAHGPSYLVTFTIEKILPLLGDDPANIPFC